MLKETLEQYNTISNFNQLLESIFAETLEEDYDITGGNIGTEVSQEDEEDTREEILGTKEGRKGLLTLMKLCCQKDFAMTKPI